MSGKSGTKGLGIHVALLRGINVGGRNKLPMKDLRELFDNAGCVDVSTYIQSGNVIFRAGKGLAGGISDTITEAIEDRFGLQVPVVTRTANELRKVAKVNPFLAAGADLGKLSVAFLADQPTQKSVATLDAGRSAPDEFSVRGREIYLHLPNGVARTKLTNAYFDSRLGTISTARNWRTTLKLIELMAAAST